MRTTLKSAARRATEPRGRNGHGIFPPAPLGRVVRYRQPPPPPRTPFALVRRILVGVLLLALSLAAAAGGGAYLWFHQSVAAVHAHSRPMKIAEKHLKTPLPDHPAIAVVVGSDVRAGAGSTAGSRSDTVMLIRADPQTKTISLLSIPRDLGVPIYCPKSTASLGTSRINAAYADCGPAGTVDTVQHLTGLPINYVISVNFHGFKEIVDKLGGVWLDIDRRYYNPPGDGYAAINIQPGYERLTGGSALAFVRYRHTDDDYHRVARQQEFVQALKDQLAHNFDPLELPAVVSAVVHNVEVGGTFTDETVLGWGLFAARLPGGHVFQDKIQNITGTGMTYAPPQSISAAVYQFTHPNVGSSKAASAAALGKKPKPKKKPHHVAAPAPKDTAVTVLNGNGVAGAATNGAYLLAERGYRVLDPPNQQAANAPSQTWFHTQIYYDPHRADAKAAAAALAPLLAPADVRPLPADPALRALDPGSLLVVVLGETFHNALTSQAPAAPPAPPAPKHVPAAVRYDTGPGLELLEPLAQKAGFPLEAPTILEQSSEPDTYGGDDPSRLYAIDRGHMAIRLVFRTGAGQFWGIEETDMPDPPILDDKSFQHDLGGREFQEYWSGSNLHMVVLRVGDRSYWVVNSLLDDLSPETMIAIAKGLKPLAAVRASTG